MLFSRDPNIWFSSSKFLCQKEAKLTEKFDLLANFWENSLSATFRGNSPFPKSLPLLLPLFLCLPLLLFREWLVGGSAISTSMSNCFQPFFGTRWFFPFGLACSCACFSAWKYIFTHMISQRLLRYSMRPYLVSRRILFFRIRFHVGNVRTRASGNTRVV